jgi:hypothetical protein
MRYLVREFVPKFLSPQCLWRIDENAQGCGNGLFLYFIPEHLEDLAQPSIWSPDLELLETRAFNAASSVGPVICFDLI